MTEWLTMELNFLQAFKRFPRFAYEIVVSLCYLCLAEEETFLLAVTSILIGCLTGPLVAFTVFFGTYFVTKMIGGYITFIASKL